MRPIWTGAISFGLVNIPISLMPAINTKEKIHFHLLHKTDHARIEYQKYCPLDNETLDWDDIVKGYEYKKGKYVIINEDDFKKADPKASETIEISDFVKVDEIEPIFFTKPYFIAPKTSAKKAYFLLKKALEKTERVGIAKFVLRDKEYLAMIRPYKNILQLEIMHFAEEIAETKKIKIPSEPKIKKDELNLAINLITSLDGKFEPKKFKDEYHDKLMAIIKKKIKGEKIVTTKIPTIKMKDLKKALQKSVSEVKKK